MVNIDLASSPLNYMQVSSGWLGWSHHARSRLGDRCHAGLVAASHQGTNYLRLPP